MDAATHEWTHGELETPITLVSARGTFGKSDYVPKIYMLFVIFPAYRIYRLVFAIAILGLHRFDGCDLKSQFDIDWSTEYFCASSLDHLSQVYILFIIVGSFFTNFIEFLTLLSLTPCSNLNTNSRPSSSLFNQRTSKSMSAELYRCNCNGKIISNKVTAKQISKRIQAKRSKRCHIVCNYSCAWWTFQHDQD